MHQDVTKMCQIFKNPHTYTNASPHLCHPPKPGPSVPWGWKGSGACSQRHDSGHPQPGSGPMAWLGNGPQLIMGRPGRGGPRHSAPPTPGHAAPSAAGPRQPCPPWGPHILSPSLSWALLFLSHVLDMGAPGLGEPALRQPEPTHVGGWKTEVRDKRLAQVRVHAHCSFIQQTRTGHILMLALFWALGIQC